MTIIFDLDYTLIDTKKLKDDLADIFDKENFKSDYEKYFKTRGVNFNLATYLTILKNQGEIDEARAKELKLKLAEFMKRLDNYLFSGAENILTHLKKGGDELILLTFGDKKWHREKIKNLSLKKYFGQIIFEDKNKAKSRLLKSLAKGEEGVLIVNDNARETKAMAEIIGEKAKIFLIDGPYARNIEHNWPIYKLDELKSLDR